MWQFNNWGPLSCKHGFVRASDGWEAAGTVEGQHPGEFRAVAFRIVDCQASRELYPNQFQLTVVRWLGP